MSAGNNEYSDKTYTHKEEFASPTKILLMSVSTGAVAAAILHFGDVERRLGSLLPFENPGKVALGLGYTAVFSCYIYSMITSVGGRAKYQIALPISSPVASDTKEGAKPEGERDDQVAEKQRIRFLNGSRGYYNMLEKLPLWALATTLGKDEAPVTLGFCLTMIGLSRILYTKYYAESGPQGRAMPFIGSILAETFAGGVVFHSLAKHVIRWK